MTECVRSQVVYDLLVGGDSLPQSWEGHVASCGSCQRAIAMAAAFEERLRRASTRFTVPEIPDMRPTLASRTERRWRWTMRALAFAGTSAMVVVGALVVLQLNPRAPLDVAGSPAAQVSPDDEIRPSAEPQQETSTPSPSPSPMTEPIGTLRRMPGFEEAGASLGVLTVDGSMAVAGGQTCDFEAAPAAGPCRPALWWSTDGQQWTPVGDLPWPGGESIGAIAAGPRGWVAISDGESPVAWWSPDGRSWHAVQDLRPFEAFADGGPAMSGELCCGARVEGIAATADGFVAIGQVTCFTCVPRAAVWLSADGQSWERVPFAPAFEVGPMVSVAVAGGSLVVVGGHATWTSADAGQTWEVWPAAFGLSAAHAVVPWQGGFAAAGDANPLQRKDAAVWLSAAGTQWSAMAALPNTEMTQLIGTSELVAVGRAFDDASPGKPVIWASADGRHWDAWELESDGRPGIGGLAEYHGRLFVVGVADLDSSTHVAAIWTMPVP